jgi:hypothetical protein
LLDNAAVGDAHDADPSLAGLVTPDRDPRGHLAAFAKQVTRVATSLPSPSTSSTEK